MTSFSRVAVEPGEAVLLHLLAELLLHLPFGLGAEFQGDDLGGPRPDAVGDVVAGDVENLPVLGDPADHDMGMGMAGVVVIDRDPVQPGLQVVLHLVHEGAGEVPQVPQLRPVLGRDDQAELMAVLPAAPDERLAVGAVLDRRIDPAGLPVPGHPVALQVAQVSVGRPARSSLELHHPRLDHHPAAAEADAPLDRPLVLARERGRDLRAPPAGIEPAAPASPPAPFPAFTAGA